MTFKQSQELSSFQSYIDQCIHCGLCLQACPTYRIFGTEMDSPRGRISLMDAAFSDELESGELTSSFAEHIELCLACRSCETACPSGVRYGNLVEQARILIEENKQPGAIERFVRWVGLNQLMPYQSRLNFIGRLMYIYQKSNIQNLVRSTGWLPEPLKSVEAVLPAISPPSISDDPIGFEPRDKCGTVLFFTGCIQESFLSNINRATVFILQRNGYQVITPQGQTCCGAAHLHLGDIDFAKKLARQNINTFTENEVELTAIINNAGGCGLSLKEYAELLKDDPLYSTSAEMFSSRVFDANEFICQNLNEVPQGEINKRVTYVDSCHLRHGQNVVDAPRELLQAIPGVEFVELENPDQCCGSAGVYNLTQMETARIVLAAKIQDINKTQAQIVATSNTGCHMQVAAGIREYGINAQVFHVMELLEKSYRNEE